MNRNLPEPHQPSAPEQSGSLFAFCHYAMELSTNLACYLHQNPPEPSPEPVVAAVPDRTRAILG